jgi:hypothetical protein
VTAVLCQQFQFSSALTERRYSKTNFRARLSLRSSQRQQFFRSPAVRPKVTAANQLHP